MRADFLLDTSFISALFPGAAPLPDRLDAWVIESQRRFHVPTVAIAEVISGIAKLRRGDAPRRSIRSQSFRPPERVRRLTRGAVER